MQNSIWRWTLSDEQARLLAVADPIPRTADVAVVGSGLIGLMTAYYLTPAGAGDVCVLDRKAPLEEASGANAGGLWFGKEALALGSLMPLAARSSQLYDKLALEIDFDLSRAGVLELLYEPEEHDRDEAAMAAARNAGFPATRIESDEVRQLEPALRSSAPAALLFPNDGQLNPAKLAAGLIRILRSRKVRICPGIEVSEVTGVGPGITTSKGALSAGTVVITCGAWTPLLTKTLGWQPPIKPIRGQLLALGPVSRLLRHTVVAREFYHWQLAEGYIAGGGTTEDVGFERGTNPDDLARIRDEMVRLLPQLDAEPTVCAWSGFRPYCEDEKPVIGHIPGHEHVYVAAGHYRKGVMLAPITGKLLADLITTGRPELPIHFLRPDRF
jgi:glycine oxidase